MTDPEQVVEANLKFYFALESLDVDLMDEVWATDASAICVHPNWNRLAGWENIRASWEQIFRNTTFMRIDVSEVSVEVQGTTAWVSCDRAEAPITHTRTGSEWVETVTPDTKATRGANRGEATSIHACFLFGR